MKVYILVDSEGQAAITREQDPVKVYGPWQADYNRRRATDETKACVEGALAAGAAEILVHDCGFIRGVSPGGLLLYYDELPRGIKIAMGGAAMHKVLATDTFDAVIFLGHHAMSGTPNAVMPHTFSASEVENMWLNGKKIGEIAVEALQFGVFNVPVAMVSADEAGCNEAKEWLGDVEVAPTKKGLGRHQAISLHPKDADELIRRKTIAALKRVKDFKPYRMPGPLELRVDCYMEDQADLRAKMPLTERIGPKSVRIRTQNPLELTYQMTAAGSWSWLGGGETRSIPPCWPMRKWRG